MRKKNLLFVAMMALVLTFVPVAYGAILETSDSGSTTLTEIGTAGGATLISASAHAANISALNIVTDTETSRWAGFIGNVSGTIGLSGGLSNSLFEFDLSASAIDGLAATADTNFDWSSLTVVQNSSVDSMLNLGTDAGDSITVGWVNETATWLSVDAANTINLYDNSQASNTTWAVSVLADTASPATDSLEDVAWIANATVTADGSEFMSFNGDRTVEYQMIVGVNNTVAQGSAEQVIYNFWIVDN